MVAGLTFPYYNEARLTFLPTYRFDLGTDIFDSSEKARIPAWTDRILKKGPNLRQLAYDSVTDIRFSDHRPVLGLFQCLVTSIDQSKQEKLSRELYSRRRLEIGEPTWSLATDEEDGDEEAIDPGCKCTSMSLQIIQAHIYSATCKLGQT